MKTKRKRQKKKKMKKQSRNMAKNSNQPTCLLPRKKTKLDPNDDDDDPHSFPNISCLTGSCKLVTSCVNAPSIAGMYCMGCKRSLRGWWVRRCWC